MLASNPAIFSVMIQELTTIVFLYNHQEDGQITGRNVFVNILKIAIHHKTKLHLFVVPLFYKSVWNVCLNSKMNSKLNLIELRIRLDF